MMLHKDGTYTIYLIERFETAKGGRWQRPNWDLYSTHSGRHGFSACGDCWQQTGIKGSFDYDAACDVLKHMRRVYHRELWRLVKMVVSQHTVPEWPDCQIYD